MNPEDTNLIEAYLSETLSQEERLLFQKKMKEDADFREKVLIEKQLSETLDENNWSFVQNPNKKELSEYKKLFESEETQELKRAIQTASNTARGGGNRFNRNWILFSSAALLAIMFSIFSVFNSDSTTEELYATYFNPDSLPTIAVRGDNPNSELLKAQQLFERKNYAEALPIFESQLKSSEQNKAVIYLYKGVSHMELEQFPEAEATFSALINSDLMDASKGYWYKALLYLKMKDAANAKLMLTQITSNTHYNYKKAAELLKELE